MAGDEPPAVTIDLLGPVQVVFDGAPVQLGSAQQRAVLAVLAGSPGRVLPREYLVDAIWGDHPPGYVVNLLQKHMSGLRGALAGLPGGRDLVKWAGTGYLLAVDENAIDLIRAERLIGSGREHAAEGDARAALADFDAALALWRGTPLDGLSGPLLDTERERVGELRLSAVEARLTQLSQLGRHVETVAELSALVGSHPLRESLWEALMLALFRSGRQADALAAYQRLRVILQDELGIDPSGRIRELHRAVLTADPSLSPPTGADADLRRAASVVARADAAQARPAPAQLPTAVRHMVGRATQMASLDAAVDLDANTDGDAAHVVGVTGPAGVGKTAVVLTWAHAARPRFPDGQLYINLRGFDPSGQTVDPLDAIRHFVDAFGIRSDDLPDTPEGLVALYRSLLADRRVLVVLDNARDVEQVRLLIPGSSSSVVVITSRSLLSGLVVDYDAQLFALDLFRRDDSRAMLVARLGGGRAAGAPSAVDEIIDRCGGLPLTLAIVAGRAVAHPEFHLDDIAAELRNASSRLDPFAAEDGSVDVRSVFSWSYDKLSEGAARVFRLLGLSPAAETAVPAAASLAGMPVPRVRAVLNELARLHLLIERSPGRYVMHDLVRAHAQELATAVDTLDERNEAVGRLLQHYLYSVDSATAQLVDTRDEPSELPPQPTGIEVSAFTEHAAALEWLRREKSAIEAAWWRGWEVGDLPFVWRLATRYRAYLAYRADWTLMETMLSVAATAARDGGAIGVQAQLCLAIGGTLLRLGRYEQAREWLDESNGCYREAGDPGGQAYTERFVAWSYQMQGHPDDMISHAERGLDIARESGDDATIGRALNSLGWSYAHDARLEEAVEYCESALTMLRAKGDRYGEAETLDSLGFINFRRGDPDAGARYYSESADLYSSFGDEYNAADTRVNLGDAQAEAGQLDEAIEVWTRALETMRRLGSTQAQAVQQRISSASQVARQ